MVIRGLVFYVPVLIQKMSPHFDRQHLVVKHYILTIVNKRFSTSVYINISYIDQFLF